MKTVTGRVISAEPISLSKAATLLSGFTSSENGATQAVSAYLRRASAAFTELKSIHREIKSSSLKDTKRRSDVKHEHNPTGEYDELGRAKGIDDLVENGGKIGFRKSEAMFDEEAINEIKKKKKKNSKKKKEEDVVDEKVKEKLEDEQQRNEERNEEKKKKKKKRKTDGEMGSEERKNKKKRKSKEIDG